MLEHIHSLISAQSYPGSEEIVHPVTIDGSRNGADGGVYSARLHDDIPPVFFNYLVIVPFLS